MAAKFDKADLPDWVRKNARAEIVSSFGASRFPAVKVYIMRVTPSGQIVTDYNGETKFTQANRIETRDGTEYRKPTDKGHMLTLRQIVEKDSQ
jgi:hypothetical protein